MSSARESITEGNLTSITVESRGVKVAFGLASGGDCRFIFIKLSPAPADSAELSAQKNGFGGLFGFNRFSVTLMASFLYKITFHFPGI